jgi:CheY-like chemotaxis protein
MDAISELPPPATDLRVLVVDDDELNREVALRQLAGLGIKGDAAADGAEALRKLGEQPGGRGPDGL